MKLLSSFFVIQFVLIVLHSTDAQCEKYKRRKRCKRNLCTWNNGSCSPSSSTDHPTQPPFTSAPITPSPVTNAPVTPTPVTLLPTFAPTSVVENGDFETGNVIPWSALGSSISVTTTEAHLGSHSVLVSDRNSDNWNGVQQNVMGKLLEGVQYDIEGWAKLPTGTSATNQSVRITIRQIDDGGTRYFGIGSTEVSDSGWSKISGSFTLNVQGTLTDLTFYSEGPDAFISYLMDDVICARPTSAPTQPPATPAPVTAAPVTSAPITSAPITPSPVTSAPVTPAPVTAAPISAPPTFAPVTSAPVTSAPITPSPVTSAPVTPAPVTLLPTFTPTSVVENGDFETGNVIPWSALGSSISVTTTEAHLGSHSVLVSDRNSDNWNGVQQNVMGKLLEGVQYDIEGWAKLPTGTSATNQSVRITIRQIDDGGTRYFGIGSTEVSDSGWSKISGSFTLNVQGTLTDLTFYSEGPDAFISYLMDDVICARPTSAPTQPPATPAPVTAAPVTSAPITSAPITPSPVTSAPVTPAPVTAAPISAPPTFAPVTSAPVTSAPITPSPVTSAPVTPTPVTLLPTFTPTSVVENGDFETGNVIPWSALGSSISVTTTEAHLGSHSVLVSDRNSDNWNGVQQNVMGKLLEGVQYDIEGWAKLPTGTSATNQSVRITIRQIDDGGTRYFGIGSTEVSDSGWSKISGSFTLNVQGTLTDLTFYSEGPDAFISYLMDDVICARPTSAPTQPPATPAPVTAAPVTSAPITSAPITPSPVTSAPVTPAPVTAAPISAPPTFAPVTSAPVTSAPITPSPVTSAPVTPAPVTLLPTFTPTSVVENGDFETGNVIPWSALGSSISVTTTEAHLGSHSVLVSDRNSDNWNGVQQNVMGKLLEGVQYDIEGWAKLPTGTSATNQSVRITIRQIDDGGTRYFGIGSTEVSDSGWSKISGSFTLNVQGTLTDLTFYSEGPDAFISYLMDDVICVSPTSTPTQAPTTPITSSPSFEGETNAPTAFPEGPYILPEFSSENVVIPEPAVPNLNEVRTNCPHLQGILLDWHEPSTWEGQIPSAGSDVTLPANSKVVVTQSVVEELGLVIIPSTSQLIFGENSDGIRMDVEGMDVQGILRAGSEECRLETSLTITLHGDRPADITTNAVAPSYKGISVTGTVELHGKRYYRTWTKLAKSASPGDNFILLQHPVNWEPGQEIVLITTAVKDSREWHQNEKFTVASVGTSTQVGSIVYLTSTITHSHIANSGYQAEVGLLTRMITIQGAEDDSEPTDPDPLTCTGNWNFGNTGAPCPNTELTGYGGHIMVHSGGTGFVEGVELFRMGQTNVLGRYPMHFHVLGNECEDCYFKDSSVHRSFYRCISIHGTHNTTVSENVAYDVTGYCYYLEDGIEEDNTISFNLAAHVHIIGTPATGSGQTTPLTYQSSSLTLPADVTASGYYITNVHNNIIGNAASGGWSGFAFPVLYSPLGPHKDINYRPSSQMSLVIDGNTAHSTGWWWYHAGAFYLGGSLYYDTDGTTLVYNAGRDQSRNRQPCLVDKCAESDCNNYCYGPQRGWNSITNTKTFLVPSVGMNSWSGRMEVKGYEAHDVALALEALESGFWIDDMLVVCRTGENLIMPSQNANYIKGNGFFWYDTGQEHIITNTTFRNCGYRSEAYNQYDTSPTRGCDGNSLNGCSTGSTVFGFLTHSDQFTPELMQGTKDISFEDCGRRFRLFDFNGDSEPSTVSGRGQNWVDVDGSISGFNEATLIGSGLSDAGLWWKVEPQVVHDPQGPLEFIKQSNGNSNGSLRGLGHIRLSWDASLHNTVGGSSCGNGNQAACPPVGHVRHYGSMFESDVGLPVTANPDIVGPVGGFGWLLSLNGGAPHTLDITGIEVLPETPLILGIVYPLGTSFSITANAAYCYANSQYSCIETFIQANSADDVRTSDGNLYHFDAATGLLTIRIIMYPQTFTGNPAWQLWDNDMTGKYGSGMALDRFERGGVFLPQQAYGPYLQIAADCNRNGAYCSQTPDVVNPNVCSSGYEQVAYDKCCQIGNPSVCQYA